MTFGRQLLTCHQASVRPIRETVQTNTSSCVPTRSPSRCRFLVFLRRAAQVLRRRRPRDAASALRVVRPGFSATRLNASDATSPTVIAGSRWRDSVASLKRVSAGADYFSSSYIANARKDYSATLSDLSINTVVTSRHSLSFTNLARLLNSPASRADTAPATAAVNAERRL